MIFVTVGAQMPFDRMVGAIDQWAGARGRRDVFAQIGSSSLTPENIEWIPFLNPVQFRAKVEQASLVVAHAGMGSIITALELGKPLLIMPRRGDRKETRNDHQVATARQFLVQRHVAVAFDEVELALKLDEIDRVAAIQRVSNAASSELIAALRDFVETGSLPRSEDINIDGLICFGEGDPEQESALRYCSKRIPVVYVRSGGRRRMLRDASAKIERICRGVRAGARFKLIDSPAPQARCSAPLESRAANQIKRAARRLGIRSPMIWVSSPVVAEIAGRVPHAALVYEAAAGAAPAVAGWLGWCDRRLRAFADLTIESSDSIEPQVKVSRIAGLKEGPEASWEVKLAAAIRELKSAGMRFNRDFSDDEPATPHPLSSINADRPLIEVSAQRIVEAQTVPHVVATIDAPGAASALCVLPRAVVLLAGTVRPNRFTAAIGRSPLDLPVAPGKSILDAWLQDAAKLGGGPRDDMEIRVLIDGKSPLPHTGAAPSVRMRIERDPFELRGTGGILRDLAADYDDDDFLLVIGGVNVLLRPLGRIAADYSKVAGDVVLGSHADRTPSSFMLMRCGALRGIAQRGFVDMKEQALPSIARDYNVSVCALAEPAAAPVRIESQYLAALRKLAGCSWRGGQQESAFEEDWRTRFSLVEEGAVVDPSATVHDSVVLRGATVRAGAAVVQSVVCPGGIVGKGAIVTDELIAPARRRAAKGAR